MIRVLWSLPNFASWAGGLNYFRNLFLALLSLPDRVVEPVIDHPVSSLSLSARQLISIPKYTAPHPAYWNPRHIRNLLEDAFLSRGRDYERYLRRHRIDLMSHLTCPGGWTDVPWLAWIPDFQHQHLPHFFSAEEIVMRNRHQQSVAEQAQGILLSSEDARRDFNRFYPGYESKTHVLHFVSLPLSEEELPAADQVLSKYDIKEPFFHIPNQVWAHKNHGIILEALRLLRNRGHCPLVISTGQTDDYRNAEYFEGLMEQVRDADLVERFRFLGRIDYSEVCVLMKRSLALINPSLFEGWSTTVEEAKSYGKKMILSDLPVHREQGPDQSDFFEPHHAEQLAELMDKTRANWNPSQEAEAQQTAAAALPARIQEYGRAYEAIIRRILEGHAPVSATKQSQA